MKMVGVKVIILINPSHISDINPSLDLTLLTLYYER